jgi:hypothetical protein
VENWSLYTNLHPIHINKFGAEENIKDNGENLNN